MPFIDHKLSDKQKAALVVISLGAEKAAKVYRHLSDDEVEKLTIEVASCQKIDPEKMDAVMKEFSEMCMASQYIADGGIEYARTILDRAYGPKAAIQMIGKITQSLREQSFEFLKKADHKHLLSFIQHEHPQTIALILLYTTPDQAAAILSELPRDKQLEVAIRIATMDRTSPEIVKEVETVLEKRLSSVVSTNLTKIGGVQSIADILNRVDRATEKFILDELDRTNHELSEMVRSRLFVFEDIIYLDAKGVQRVLREVETKDLAIALKGANEEVTSLIMSNLTKRMQDTIREEMEFLGPTRLSQVEEAQQRIVQIVRQLEDAGEIVISRGGKDDILV